MSPIAVNVINDVTPIRIGINQFATSYNVSSLQLLFSKSSHELLNITLG